MLVSDGMQDFPITICSRSLPVHRGKRGPVTSLLEEAGYQVTRVVDGPLEVAANGVVWILGNANWLPVICRQLAGKSRHERPFVVFWHTEPLPPPKASGLPWPRLHLREIAKILLRDPRATDVYTNYFCLRRLTGKGLPDLLVVSTLGRREFLVERGIAAHWVPLGYYPSSHGHDMGLPRDIEALFLGALEIPRRKRLIKHLRRCGVNLLAVGSWSDPEYWGENRTRLLNRTKILLNISRHPGNLSDHRMNLGMANKALVISEPMYNPAPYVPGKHYISATIEEMPEVISYYLAHDDERQRIVNEGHRLVTQEVTMARSVSRILELIRECIN